MVTKEKLIIGFHLRLKSNEMLLFNQNNISFRIKFSLNMKFL